MKLQIIIPAQETYTRHIELHSEVTIIGEVTGFWKYTYNDESYAVRWGINPSGLLFSSFGLSFSSIVLEKTPFKDEFQLDAEYQYTDPDDKLLTKRSVVFNVASVTEVHDFPSIASY